MTKTTCTPPNFGEQLASVELNLREIRQDVASILRSVQDELDAFREREFWRDHAQFYQEE